ncbi:uncharacterized protein LOC120626684 [Pararge aegeria]|uniref:Jg20063 protein n=2 Tax=Pararge aegeria TaxID=116150 RepID=A0A8S4SPS2_9NEOP|nr:uncharacterized protein LOC120626684 [Pararge aegeria]CAH2268568.1 jg20063 [Pararge aegeria aegeria]
MNKLLIVLLAVCLVSVHAFVKRDTAEATQTNGLANFGKELADLFEKSKSEFDKTFNPDKLKKDFSALVDQISGMAQQKPDAPKA